MVIHNQIDKSNLKDDLSTILDRYSSKKLSDREIQNLNNRESNVKHYHQLLENFKNSKSNTQEQFLNTLTVFIGGTLELKEDELHQTMLIYLLSISSYINDFFNTQNLKNRKHHVKEIKKLFVDAVHNIITTYENELLKTVKKIEEV